MDEVTSRAASASTVAVAHVAAARSSVGSATIHSGGGTSTNGGENHARASPTTTSALARPTDLKHGRQAGADRAELDHLRERRIAVSPSSDWTNASGAERDVGDGLGRAREHRGRARLHGLDGADGDDPVLRACDQIDERSRPAGVEDARRLGRGGRWQRAGLRGRGGGAGVDRDLALTAAGEQDRRDERRSRGGDPPHAFFFGCAST